MEITLENMLDRLAKNEEVAVWATTLTTVGKKYASPGSPHLSIILKPTFGKIDGSGRYALSFFSMKANNSGFVKTGRNQGGVTCFSTYEEAASFFNQKLKDFISLKESEIQEAKDLLVSPSNS